MADILRYNQQAPGPNRTMEHNGTKQPNPEPGDLIEISRPGYQHWAIYIGNGDVDHVTLNGLGLASSSPSSGSVFSGTPTVKKEKLNIVVGVDRDRINNKYDHHYEPLPAKVIVERALSRVGQDISYGILSNNCEHFVTLLRYGWPVSQQADRAMVKVAKVAKVALVAVASVGIVVLALSLGLLFSWKRQ
uniref:phospholipase A and acyltransferase 3-like n=1 Tax=Myxine glutinosa TaxID=7769 RepID=UPI00358F6B9A